MRWPSWKLPLSFAGRIYSAQPASAGNNTLGQGLVALPAIKQCGYYSPQRGLAMDAPMGIDFSINNYWSQVFGPVNPSSVAGWYRKPQ